MKASAITLLLLLVLIPAVGLAQSRPQSKVGPVIEGFGAVFSIENPDFVTPLDREFKVVFDVSQAPEDRATLNRYINSVARFLNMHGQAGVPVENMHVALVLHGSAAKAVLTDEAYRARYGVDNPDRELLQALHHAGVRIVICGQSAASRGFPREEFLPEVELALSAMTAMVVLQGEGYQVHGIGT